MALGNEKFEFRTVTTVTERSSSETQGQVFRSGGSRAGKLMRPRYPLVTEIVLEENSPGTSRNSMTKG